MAHCGGEPDRGLGKERDLHRHPQRLDGQSCGVEQRSSRDRDGHHRIVEDRQSFAILGFGCDNGSEFLNLHLVNYFTCSRPYQKYDNGHLEQKNWTHVRQLVGYQRPEDPEQLTAINELYCDYCEPLRNYFFPSAKLSRKHRD